MVSTPFDLEAHHPLSPRKEVIAEYEKVKFEYEKNIQDRAYDRWYYLVNGRPITQEVTQIYRQKKPGKGEYLFYNLQLTGKDWKGNAKTFSILQGRYEKPIFDLEMNPENQQVTTTQMLSHESVYDIPFTKEKLDELLLSAADPISLIVYGSEGRKWGVQSLEDYRDGTIEDLVTSTKTGKSLKAVLVERNQFTYEKRESKQK